MHKYHGLTKKRNLEMKYRSKLVSSSGKRKIFLSRDGTLENLDQYIRRKTKEYNVAWVLEMEAMLDQHLALVMVSDFLLPGRAISEVILTNYLRVHLIIKRNDVLFHR